MIAETPAQPSAGPQPPGRSARTAGFPWRALALAASVVVLDLSVGLLAFAFPFSAFLAALDGRPRRFAAAALAVALPLSMALNAPEARFFVAASALAVIATLLVLRLFPRTGYPEVALAAFAGLLVAAALWLWLDPGFFGQARAAVEGETQRVMREVSSRLASSAGLDSEGRAGVDEVLAASARWYARLWPAGAFLVLWLGVGVALELAARWSRGQGGLASRVMADEPFSVFRLPDAWVWILLVGMAGFLALPRETAAGEAALNAALVATGLYACQGTAVALYYLERRGIGPVRRALGLMLAVLLLPVPLLVSALCLGLADIWLDLRHRPRAEGAAGPRP